MDGTLLVCFLTPHALPRMTRNAYHARTSGQPERYNKTIIDRLRHYVSEHWSDWDAYDGPLSYGYNARVHRSACAVPFSQTFSPEPPYAADIVPPTKADNADRNSSKRPKQTILTKISLWKTKETIALQHVQLRYMTNFDSRGGRHP